MTPEAPSSAHPPHGAHSTANGDAALTPAALAATHAAAFTGDRPWSAEEFAALLSLAGMILTGDARSFILGRVTLDEAEILTIATRPDARRQGLARARLAQFEDAAEIAGATSVFLEVAADNNPALALYQTSGYAQVGRRRGYYHRANAAPADALVLGKPILPPRHKDSS